jgi:hypothetical protein
MIFASLDLAGDIIRAQQLHHDQEKNIRAHA